MCHILDGTYIVRHMTFDKKHHAYDNWNLENTVTSFVTSKINVIVMTLLEIV